MERKGKVRKVRYFAVDDDGNPFPVFYGKNAGDVFFSDDLEKVAHNIAYYCHRCYPTLMTENEGKTKKASPVKQEKFTRALEYEFFYYENR